MNPPEATMFTNVMVGVDGREGGTDAIALARQLATPGARIILAHVHSSDWALGRASGTGAPLARENFDRILEDQRQAAGIEAELVSGAYTPPARGLHALAEQRRADLIVVGSPRYALLGRVLMGDVARTTLHGAPCPVAVAPAGYAAEEPAVARLGVGYDGSDESALALKAAQEVAHRHGASVTALWVVSPDDVRRERPRSADWSETSEVLVNRRLDQLHPIEGIEADVVYGDPREELARLSERVDLLLTGSRGHGALGRLAHGSISSYLFSHAACPLVVVPRRAVSAGVPGGDELTAASGPQAVLP